MKRSNNLPFQLLFLPLSIPFIPLVLLNPLPFALCSLFIFTLIYMYSLLSFVLFINLCTLYVLLYSLLSLFSKLYLCFYYMDRAKIYIHY